MSEQPSTQGESIVGGDERPTEVSSRPWYREPPILASGAVLVALIIGLIGFSLGRQPSAPAAGAAPALTSADSRMIAGVRAIQNPGANIPEKEIIYTGHMLCDRLRQGRTFAQLATDNPTIPMDRMVGLTGAAVSAYCPEMSASFTVQAAVAASNGQTAQPVAATPALPAGSYGPGTYQVGTDIQPGTYKSAGADTSLAVPSCYWERMKDLSGGLGSILANDRGNGPQVVTIKPTDRGFKTTGCLPWTKIG